MNKNEVKLEQFNSANDGSLALQWAQLIALTCVHALVDMYAGMLPVIMPAVRERFGWGLKEGINLVFILYITCNVMQIATGHMRSQKTKPFFMYIGLVIAAAMCLMAVVPTGDHAIDYVTILVIISGCGIAVTHPEGLRGIHRIKLITPAMSTAIFMAGGFVGFAGGGFVATFLVERFGLEGLFWLTIFSMSGILSLILLRIRLAVETKNETEIAIEDVKSKVSFWPLMLMAIPTTSATTVFYTLIPTRLNELGFKLTFGGKSTLILGVGSAIGYIIWAKVSHKINPLKLSIILHLAGVPLMYVYLSMIESADAGVVLFFVGFTASAAYPLIVTIARNAKGPGLGQRMALIVGGAWGLSAVPLKLLAPIADSPNYGVHFVLALSPIGYVVAAAVGFLLLIKARRQEQPSVQQIDLTV